MATTAPVRLLDKAGGIDVPFFDWKALYEERSDDYRRIIHETASKGGFILQAAVETFERKLAAYLGAKHAIGLSDCTNAMLLGLRASGVQRGDEIILPGHAFIAAAQAIHFAGCIPVPVDLDEEDGWLIDPEAVRAAITPQTRGIMAVHVNGRVCAMGALKAIADDHGLEIYEDAAQALGARLDGRAAGTFGRWAAFSFYPSKTLGCFGDGGALVTNDDDVAAVVRAMRNHGAGFDKTISPDCAVWGTNARLDNIQAAILEYKLGWYEQTIERRRAIARRYSDAFSGIRAIELPPEPESDRRHFDIFQNYEIRCHCRDALRQHLESRGIGTIEQWGGVPIHRFRGLGFTQHLPRTDRFFEGALLLPMNHLLGEDQVDAIIGAVQDLFN
ncbi:MAG TPA: DegT/DnrJ/EryC1/StrS family aminotransferase [Sphingomicrobium sp.]